MAIKDFIKDIQHLGLPTNDLKATVAFYEKLGFEIEYSTDATGETVCFLRLGNVVVETYENGKAVGAYGAWDHIALDTDDLDGALGAVKAAGLPIVEGPRELPFWEKGVRYFTVEGPNKEKVEFNQIL